MGLTTMYKTTEAAVKGVGKALAPDVNVNIPEPEKPPEQNQTETVKAATDARRRQTRRATAASGRSSTILTGPLGLTGSASQSGRKTLLGL